MKSGNKITTKYNSELIATMGNIHVSDNALTIVEVEGENYGNNSIKYLIPLKNIDYYEVIE